jgi:hypothetical protein
MTDEVRKHTLERLLARILPVFLKLIKGQGKQSPEL